MFKNVKKILIPFIIFIFAVVVIFIYSFTIDKNEDNEKTHQNKNIISNEETSHNDIIEDIGDVYSSCVPEELVYATAYIQPGTEIDLSSTTEIYEYSDLVIVGTIKEKHGGKMLEEFEYAGLFGTMKVEKVIKGNLSGTEVDFFTNGGYCTVKEYINVISKTGKEKLERMGFDKLSDEVKNNNYLIFNYKYGKNFEEGNRYVLMLKKVNDKYICLSNYGFLDIDSNTSIDDLSDILNISK